MGIETLEIETRSIEGILGSIREIGVKFNREEKAEEIVDQIRNTINTVKKAVDGLGKPTVLVTYYRNVGEGMINEVYIAGNHTYYNELIAGGINAYQGTNIVTSPIVTPEGILSMDPDVIVELMSMIRLSGVSLEDVLKDWEMLSDLKAFKNKQIHIFNQSYSGLPGPRLHLAIRDMAHFIHPELDLEEQ
jgi:iron complex transport system substrate-binding protein